MSTTLATPRRARAATRSPWLARLARLGTAASGFVYSLVGVLAIGVAVGAGGQTTGGKGALATLAAASWGNALLVALAVGFGGYALWRLVVAATGRGVESTEREDWPHRAAHLVGALVYAALCWVALSVLTGGSGGGSEQEQTAQLLGLPGGRWLVLALGLGVLGFGVYAVYKGLSQRFLEELETGRMSRGERRWPCRLGIVGYTARGVVYLLSGIFLVKAAIEFDPQESRGLDGALAELAQQPYGRALLGVVAAGLVAYGVYAIVVRARYRKV